MSMETNEDRRCKATCTCTDCKCGSGSSIATISASEAPYACGPRLPMKSAAFQRTRNWSAPES